MPSFTETWIAVPVGTTPNAQNSSVSQIAIAAGDEITTVAGALHGNRSLRMDWSGPGAGATRLIWDQSESGRYVMSIYFKVSEAVTAFEDLAGIRHSSGYLCVASIGVDNKLIMVQSNGAGVSGSRAPETLPINTWIRLDLAARKGTSTTDGYIAYAYYIGDSATPVHTWDSAVAGTAVNTGTANIAAIALGRTTGRAAARSITYGVVRGETKSSGFLTPFVMPPQRPVITVESPLMPVDPGMSVTMRATAEDLQDGSVATSVSQVSGPSVAVTKTGAAFNYVAPPTLQGATLTFRFRAQGSSGLVATQDIDHTIRPATERVVRGGAEVPAFWRRGN